MNPTNIHFLPQQSSYHFLGRFSLRAVNLEYGFLENGNQRNGILE